MAAGSLYDGELPKMRLYGQFVKAAFCKLLYNHREVRTVG
jgi:hypothetical protein